VNLLLDTHILLWWLNDDPALTSEPRRLIGDAENLAFVSAVVIWEIRIKEALGKLTIPNNFREVLEQQPFHSLDVTAEHAHALADLPSHHRDPFDRMLIAQARVERMTLVTRDPRFAAYDVSLVTT
jgi:PIN domain nuclease of toxin-antitoxin system